MPRFSMPKKFKLWGGFVVPIVYWSGSKMKKALGKNGEEAFANQDLFGYWDGVRIVINADEPLYLQLKTLAHELVHCVHDYGHWLDQTYIADMREAAGMEVLKGITDDPAGKTTATRRGIPKSGVSRFPRVPNNRGRKTHRRSTGRRHHSGGGYASPRQRHPLSTVGPVRCVAVVRSVG